MRKELLLMAFLVVVSIYLVYALADFTSSATTSTVKSSSRNQTINISITASTVNITNVTIVLPSGITFVFETNNTNSTTWKQFFYYDPDNVFGSSRRISWDNGTTSKGVINATQSAWFSFKVNTTLVFKPVNMTIYVMNLSSNPNTPDVVNLTIIIEPNSVSTTRNFGALPSPVYINWTNNYQENITIIGNQSTNNTITIEVFNTTSSFTANYSQYNDYASCLNSANYLLIQNASTYSNISGTFNGTNLSSNNVNLTLIYNISSSVHPCSPGRYWLENLTIRNYTNSSEQTYVSVILDVPISGDSTNNQLSNTTGVGTFGYSGYSKIPTNSTQYHSYFFNATSSTGSYIRNATSVVINLTGWASSQDIDLFLFDNSGNLKTKSINKNTSEHIVYSYLPSSNQMWEIRLYGNSTNTSGIPYYGYIIFNTLNMTNASDTNRQISLINFTSAFVNGFGAETAMNVSNTSRINVTLKNEGRINLTNTAESIDLYNIQRFALSGSQNMSFIVPNSTVASKLKVILNWTGDSNYSFDVYNPSGTLVMSSKNKHNYANMTGAMQEEYNETTSIGNGGFWRVQVTNNTNVTNAVYTLAALIYITPSNWITSNFSTFNFNSTGETNSTYTIQYNLTVPNDTIYGKYEGHVQYRSSSGSILRVPIEVSANTASLIVNNSFQSSSITLNENINTTLTRTMNITYNNTGNLPISISHSNSSGILNPSSSNKNISFTYVVPSTIAANSSGTINVTININTANTGDTQGNYDGWIFLIANESRPSSNFNLSLRVALSNTLTITFLGVKTNADTNTTRSTSIENVTFGFDVTYINGTALESPSALNYSNISSISLSNINISNTISLGNISNYSTTTPIYCTSGCDGWFGNNHYYVNATVPPNSIGGTYDMSLTASYQRTGTTFSGTGLGSTTGKYLVVNNSGLYMGYTNSSSFSLQPTNVTRFYVNVTNYGPVDSNASLNSINFTESCADYSISGADTNAYGTGCSISSYSPTANTYNITVPANGTTCIFWWTITAASTGNASTCTAYTKASGTFFNPDGLSVPIIVSSTSSSTTTTTTAGTATTTTTTSNMEFTSYESLVIVQQNSSNYTDVGIKNTGSKTLDVTFSIDGMNSTWYALNDTNELLVQGARAGFRAAFNIGLEDVKDYSVSYKATSATKTITQNFTFRITPAPATQVIINTTLDQHKLNMTQLEYEINQSKSKNVNVSLAEQKLAELKAKIAEAEKYIAQGDYFNANQLLATIKNLIEETKNELSKAKEIESEGKFKRIWLYVGIGVGVIILVGAGYLFWPTKSKSSQGFSLKSLKPSEKEKDFEKLKEKYKRNSE